jgi:hypothetical protein
VFSDARPLRRRVPINVAHETAGALRCSRCQEPTAESAVAFYTRPRAGGAFDPWCALCAEQLVRWAGAGALASQVFDSTEAADRMEELLSRGSW